MQMNFSGRRVFVIAVLVAWTVAFCIILSRWEKVARYFAINNTTALGLQTPHHKGATSQSLDTGDELAIQVGSLTGSHAALEVNSTIISPTTRLGAGVKRFSTSGLGRQKGFDLNSWLNQNGILDFRDVARYPVADDYLTSMEREILADGPLTDLTRLASPDTSQLDIVDMDKDRNVRVGETIMVRILVKDTKGRPVLKGGHQVRVWVVGKEKTPRSAAVDVTDFNNGTYVASVPVLWPGRVEVRASLNRPREFNRIVLLLMNTMKMMNGIAGSFVSNTTDEVTMCSFIPVVPGYEQLCNLTSLNGGLPWYCGRPSTPGVKCHHWAWTSYLAFPERYPLTDKENALMSQYTNKKAPCLRKLKQKILLTAVAGEQSTPAAKKAPCRPVKPRDTWEDESPRGYWENNSWRPFKGCPLRQVTGPDVLKCLHNTSFLSFGDSNAIRVMYGIQGYTRCKQLPDPLKKYHPTNLHVPIYYHCPQRNIRLTWYPQCYPFFTGYNMWSDRKVKISLRQALERLPTTNEKYVVMVHLYAHFVHVHTYAYVQHVKEAARAIRDLLKRNRNVRVFIRGPHVMSGAEFRLFSDLQTERCLRVLKQEFQDLRDKVVLMNTWDMTIACENCDSHPPAEVVTALCHTIFEHLCPDIFIRK